MRENMREPLLSVCLITYNHVKYIREAIEGVLMQKVNFSWEFIIADDCSTDGTREIVLEYKKKYPKFIKLILQDKNVGPAKNWIDLITYPKSKYVAYFEGDDYWIDPLKLQKQVDFLEEHPDYSICFHKVKILKLGRLKKDNITKVPSETTTIEDLAKYGNYIHTISSIFKNKNYYNLGQFCVGDYPLHLINAQTGKIKYINKTMAVYRIHDNGIWSNKTQNEKMKNWLGLLSSLIPIMHYEVKHLFIFQYINLFLNLYKSVTQETEKYLLLEYSISIFPELNKDVLLAIIERDKYFSSDNHLITLIKDRIKSTLYDTPQN
ncbi:MAG: glycosyltransferase [Bacteroidota bacterium]